MVILMFILGMEIPNLESLKFESVITETMWVVKLLVSPPKTSALLQVVAEEEHRATTSHKWPESKNRVTDT